MRLSKKKNISKIWKTQKQPIHLGLGSNPSEKSSRPSDADISHLRLLYKGNKFQDTILFSLSLEKKFEEAEILYFYRGLSFRALGLLRQAVDCQCLIYPRLFLRFIGDDLGDGESDVAVSCPLNQYKNFNEKERK